MRCDVYKRDGEQKAMKTTTMKTKHQHRKRSAQASSLAKLFNSSPSLFRLLISCCSALLLPCLGFSPVNQPCSQNSSSLSSFRLSLSGRLRMLPIE